MPKTKKSFTCSLTLDLYTKFHELGGNEWVRKMVAEADLSTRVEPNIIEDKKYSVRELNDDEWYLYTRLLKIKHLENHGRTVSIYPEWRVDFNKFKNYVIEKLGPKPSYFHALVLVDKSGLYEPGNVAWGVPKNHNSTYNLPSIDHPNLKFSIDGNYVSISLKLPYPDGRGSTKLKTTSIRLTTRKKSKNLTQDDIDSAIKRAVSLVNVAEQKALAQDFQGLMQMYDDPMSMYVDTGNIPIPFQVDLACLMRAIGKNA